MDDILDLARSFHLIYHYPARIRSYNVLFSEQSFRRSFWDSFEAKQYKRVFAPEPHSLT